MTMDRVAQVGLVEHWDPAALQVRDHRGQGHDRRDRMPGLAGRTARPLQRVYPYLAKAEPDRRPGPGRE